MIALRSGRVAAAAVTLALSCPVGTASAVAETKAMLQVNADGRAGANRHRLALTSRAADGRDVMLVISCRVDNAATYGVALDLGAGPIWNIEGESVRVSQDGAQDLTRRMDVRDEYLTLGGRSAIAAFKPLLAAGSIGFAVRGRYTASFDLAAVGAEVRRFRELCPT
ncbi:hypothetical protein [Bosea sp. (in: a-proteobacteria)]|uniref:hypothetical protein n=1 Tax=Bosea sp. (in: a-proteobacteria) TaxID=1871050 RepID=UPI002FCA1B07